MSDLSLVSVKINNNYIESGDQAVIQTAWQNAGDSLPDFNAKIVAEIRFSGRQRIDLAQKNSFRFEWTPFPSTDMWRSGDIWTTSAVFKFPTLWGGSYKIDISLLDENGKSIAFIGKGNRQVYSQDITEIDVGWGWGRKRLLEQRKPLSIKINEANEIKTVSPCETVKLNGYSLNKKYPAICGYENSKWYDFPPEINIRSVSDNKTFACRTDVSAKYRLNVISHDKCEYIAKTEYCSFGIGFTFKNNLLLIKLSDVQEKDGYELVNLKIPSLIQCFSEDGTLYNYYGGGRKISLKSAVQQTALFPYDTCSALGIGDNSNSFALVTDDMDAILTQSVVKHNEEDNVGVIGAIITNRVKADKAGMKSIPVKTLPLEIHHCKGTDWMLSAEILRDRLPEACKYRYENTLMYKIRMDASGQIDENRPETYSPILSLKDIEKIIMRIYELSGGMEQVVYLVGWQEGGHDFEYPYPYLSGFNSKCGTVEEFTELREKLKKYNVNLSLHDNFDDAYLSDNYAINNDIIAIDERGENWKGWLWAGGMSYIISPTAYLKSPDIRERINAVSEKYGISGTYHLDVMSSEVRRYSFKEGEHSCALENAEAKCKIIELFNDIGIDITSETLAQPFIGKMGYAQNTRCNFDSELFAGDKSIPLTTVAFHGVTPYKMGAGTEKASLLRSIAVGASCSLEIESCADSKELERNLLRNIYITSLPMSKLSYKKVIFATAEDNKWSVSYQDNSSVEVDFDKQTYTVKSNGEIISKDFVTFMPVSEDKYFYYSIYGGETELSLPDKWKNVSVTSLTECISDNMALDNGKMKFCFKPDTPYALRKV